MIVTCESCSTSFQLDEARIPPTGARVRCSRCKHAFFLARPAASGEDVLHAIAEEAAESAAVLPSASRDLEDSWNDLNASASDGPGDDVVSSSAETSDRDSLAPDVEGTALGDAPGPEVDEEDWQFSEEVRIEGDEVDEAFDAVFASDEKEALSDPAGGFEIGALSEEVASAPSGLERDESSFGSVEDFSSWMEDEEPAAEELEPEAAEVPLDVRGESGSVGEQVDDLGEPEDWDLLSNDLAVASTAPVSSWSPTDVTAPRPRVEVGDAASSLRVEVEQTPDPTLWMESFGKGPWGRLARVIGWGATLAALLVVGHLLAQAEASRWSQSPVSVVSGPVRATTGASGWVETSRSGELLRVVGSLENAGREAVVPGLVSLVLLDSTGRALAMPPVPAGVPLAPQALRESPPEALASATAEAVAELRSSPLAGGGERPFEVLVPARQLPQGAARYLLRMDAPEPVAPVSTVSGSGAQADQLRASSRP